MTFRAITFVLFSCAAISCNKNYLPANTYSPPPYFMVEHDDKDTVGTHYISSDYSKSKGNYARDRVEMLRTKYTYAFTDNFYSVNLGLSGSYGKYLVTTEEIKKLNRKHNFWNIGLDITGAAHYHFRNLQFGVGTNFSLCYENGQYYDFRNYNLRSPEENLLSKDPKHSEENFMVSLLSFTSYRINESMKISFQIFYKINNKAFYNFSLNYKNYGIFFSRNAEAYNHTFNSMTFIGLYYGF